jgi:septum site-determining protein MinD
MVARQEMLSVEDVLEILNIELVGIVPEDESVVISTNRGQPLVLTGLNGASAGQAFRNIARRLGGEDVPFLDLSHKESFMDRLKGWVNGRSG